MLSRFIEIEVKSSDAKWRTNSSKELLRGGFSPWSWSLAILGAGFSPNL